MKNLLTIATMIYSVALISQTDIKGLWQTGDENTIIEIKKSDEKWLGKIKSSDNQKAQKGKVILKNLVKKKSKWTGEIYSYKRKKWYDVAITAEEDILELKISVLFLSKTLEWSKQSR